MQIWFTRLSQDLIIRYPDTIIIYIMPVGSPSAGQSFSKHRLLPPPCTDTNIKRFFTCELIQRCTSHMNRGFQNLRCCYLQWSTYKDSLLLPSRRCVFPLRYVRFPDPKPEQIWMLSGKSDIDIVGLAGFYFSFRFPLFHFYRVLWLIHIYKHSILLFFI